MKTITFYSYKGGVGRSLGLATTAMWLAEEMGQKVCVMDFDLEAPGLHYKFAQAEKEGEIQTRIMNTEGIVEYLDEFSETKALPENFERFYTDLPVKQGEIKYIPAGRLNDLDYWNKLFKINWHEFFKRDEQTGLSEGTLLLLSLKDRIEKEIKPDFLLIDSRTGLTEIASITLKLFADKAILFGVNNPENIIGLKWTLQSLKADPMSKDLPLYFVISRLPLNHLGAINPQEEVVIERFKTIFETVLQENINHFFIIHADNELAWQERTERGYMATNAITAFLKKDYWAIYDAVFENYISSRKWNIFQNNRKAYSIFNECFTLPLSEEQQIKQLTKAIKIKPDEVNFYIERYGIYRNLKRHADAKKDIEKAMALQPNNADTISSFAIFLNGNNDFHNAEVYFKKAIALKPNSAIQLGNYALFLYNSKKEYDKSEVYFKKAIELNPDINILGNYAILLCHINKDYINAEFFLKKAIDSNAKILGVRANILGSYAQLLFIIDKKNEAEKYLKEAFAIATHEPLVIELSFYQYAHISHETSDYHKIIKLLDKEYRSFGWHFEDNIKVAIKNNHPEPEKLKALAKIITENEPMSILEGL